MEQLFVTLVAGLISYFISRSVNDEQKQHDFDMAKLNADLNESLAESSWDRQESFYYANQSPSAMMQQYKNLGATENAALSAVLGLSPATITSPTASSSASSGSMQQPMMSQLINSLVQGIESNANVENVKSKTSNTLEDTKNKILQNKYLGRINESQIRFVEAQTDVLIQRLDLDKKIFSEVTKPLAESTLNLNSIEIEKKEADIKNLFAQYDQIRQQIRNLKAQELKTYSDIQVNDASIELLDQQRKESLQRSIGLGYDNQLKGINAKLSSLCGIDITLDPVNNSIALKRYDTQVKISKFESLVESVFNTAKDVVDADGSFRRYYDKYSTQVQNYFTKTYPMLKRAVSPEFNQKYYKEHFFKDYVPYYKYLKYGDGSNRW